MGNGPQGEEISPPTGNAETAGDPTGEAAATWAIPTPPDPTLPRGRAIGDLTRAACHRLLRDRSVPFEVVDADRAEGVEQPVMLDGPIGGVHIVHLGRARRHSYLDCRLAVALLAWAPTLRAAGIARLEHYSAYRPGARVRSTGQRSGHAAGTAIDPGIFVRDSGERLAVVETWTDTRRDVDTCRPPDDGEAENQLYLRRLVCAAVTADLFQVVVTPHGNARHEDHVHLEIRPGATWTHVD